MIRVFVAVDLSSGVQKEIAVQQQYLKKILPPMNWVRPESIHLTLKFLGSIEPSRISQLLSVLEPIGKRQHRFSINVQSLGVFPHVKHPRIFWLGIKGKTQALQELVLEIEAVLDPLGSPPEEKAYQPHLTLARIKRENAIIGAAIEKSKILQDNHQIGTLAIDKFILFQSNRDSFGATYTPLVTVRLSGGIPDSLDEG